MTMLISRDPDDTPKFTTEMLQQAEELRLHPINVICDEPEARVGDATGVSFGAMVAFLPRAGDRIQLADGAIVEVERTVFKVAQRNEVGGRVSLITNQ